MLTRFKNQPINSKERKDREFNSCMILISNNLVSIFKAHSLRALAPLGIFGLLFANFTICNTTFAESVSISVSSTAETFALAPGSSAVFGKSNNITASITTDYPYGYEFTVAGLNDEQELKSATSHLPSITSSTTENNFKAEASTAYNNTWGFLPSKLNSTSNTEYQPSPTKTTPTPIDVTLSANLDPNSYTFAIAARVDNTVPKETYSSDFTLAAVANYAYFGIGFADASSGMPAVIHGLTNNGNVTFTAPAAPTKTGYTFKGWCSVETGDNGSCDNGTTYEAGTEYTISLSSNFINTHTTLYARWEPIATFNDVFRKYQKNPVEVDGVSYYKMQDMNPGICSAVSVIGEESVTQLIDTRDNNIYSIGKLVDGKCWLLDNLRLTNESVELSASNTNVSASWEGFGFTNEPYKLPPSTTACFSDLPCSNNGMGDGVNTQYTGFTVPSINADKIESYNTNDEIIEVRGQWNYGVYYNYAAASAGTVKGELNNKDAEYDICPKGWRMPTSGKEGEIQGLYTALGGGYLPIFNEDGTETAPASRASREKRIEFRKALHFPISGCVIGKGSACSVARSDFWTSTRQNNFSMHDAFITSGDITPQNYSSRSIGFSVRCVAK